MTTVTMQFGDGSFKELEMSSDDPDTAVLEAKEWVSDNSWFEVQDEQGNVLAHEPLT